MLTFSKFHLKGTVEVNFYRPVYHVSTGEYVCSTVDRTEIRDWQLKITDKAVIMWDYLHNSDSRGYDLLEKYREPLNKEYLEYDYRVRKDNSQKDNWNLTLRLTDWYPYINDNKPEYSYLHIQTWDFKEYFIDLHFPYKRYKYRWSKKEWYCGSVITKLDEPSSRFIRGVFHWCTLNENSGNWSIEK